MGFINQLFLFCMIIFYKFFLQLKLEILNLMNIKN
jgi:hypothetical protein